jgi:small subunit ribosomal protein S20
MSVSLGNLLIFCEIGSIVRLHMPITSSAKKALRSAARKRVFNTRRKIALKDAVKAARKTSGSKEEVAKTLALAYKAIDKAAKRGVIKPNTAARKKSRLARALNKTAVK